MKLPGHAFGNPVLKIEYFLYGTVIMFGPDVRARPGFDQLHGNPDAVAGFLHTAFQQIGDPQLPADIDGIGHAVLEGKSGIARDHEERANARKRRGYRLDDAIGEKILRGIAGHIVERQHRDRRLIGQRQRFGRVGNDGYGFV